MWIPASFGSISPIFGKSWPPWAPPWRYDSSGGRDIFWRKSHDLQPAAEIYPHQRHFGAGRFCGDLRRYLRHQLHPAGPHHGYPHRGHRHRRGGASRSLPPSAPFSGVGWTPGLSPRRPPSAPVSSPSGWTRRATSSGCPREHFLIEFFSCILLVL